MALSDARIHRGRPTPYPWEREALDLVYAGISDIDPYQAWELHELHDPSSGRLYELDLLFLSRVGLFLVEIKSQPGVLTGDVVDWTFTEPGGRRRTIECPYATVNHKAKVLASLLERHVEDRPFVHAAVFTPNVTAVNLDGGRPPWLLLKDDVASRLLSGLDDRMPRRIVNRPLMKALLQAAPRLGLRPSRTARIVGGFVLDKLVDEGEGYQEHLGKHQAVEHDRARIRSYLVPAATSTSRRQQLERAARREAQTLSQLGQHPGILGYRAYVDEGPLGPAVIFETFDRALPLHVFLRQEPDLFFDERLHILQSIVESVAHCHRAGVLHRNLSPASVLVRREKSGALSVRLHRFQTSTWVEHSSQGTLHVDDLAHGLDRLYQAPEVLSDPQKAIAESDVFSVGCLAWLLFTGQAPAPSLKERDQRLRASPEGGLCPSAVRPDLAALDEGISFATRPNQHERADDVAGWFDVWILDVLTRPVVDASANLDPHDANKGDQLAGGLRVERRLGSDGTALVLHVRREGKDYALKVPHDPACGERLLAEASVLRNLRHEHIVALHEVVTLADRPCLLLDFAGERTLADLLRAEGTLSLELARQTICDWHLALSELVAVLVDAMWADALDSPYLCVDATGVLVQHAEKCKRGHFFVVAAPEKHVLFAFSQKHNNAAVDELIGEYRGVLVADAHSVYDHLYLGGQVREAGCWAHARRYFFKALSTEPERARRALGYINGLFAAERELNGVSPQQRKALRADRHAALVGEFERWCDEESLKVLDESPLGKAITYAQNQRDALRTFLDDGRIPLDNNWSERELRRIAWGRDNWLFVGSEDGGDAAARFVSLIASCQLHGIEPLAYLRDLFCLLPWWPKSQVLDLAPSRWAATIAQDDVRDTLANNVFRRVATGELEPSPKS